MAHLFDPNQQSLASPSVESRSDAALESGEKVPADSSRWHRALLSMQDDVEVNDAQVPLLIQSFLTGLIDAAVYGELKTWQGFQTGNIILLASNIAEYIYPNTVTHPLEFLERGVAVAAFFLGAFIGGRVGGWWGPKCRGWHITTCLVQGALLGAAAAMVFVQPKPLVEGYEWAPGVLALTSCAMGMQAISSARLASPAFATTTAFTAALTQIAADPNLFRLPSHDTKTRDWRVFAIMALAFGGGVGRTVTVKLGLQWAFIFMVGLKVLVALRWLIVKERRGEESEGEGGKKD